MQMRLTSTSIKNATQPVTPDVAEPNGVAVPSSNRAFYVNSDLRGQLDLIRAFALENTPAFEDIPLRRLFPISIYLEKPTSYLFANLLEDLGFTFLAQYPFQVGSGFTTLFGIREKEETAADFWSNHPKFDLISQVFQRFAAGGLLIGLVGIYVQTNRPEAKPVVINVYQVRDSLAALTAAQNAEVGRIILERMYSGDNQDVVTSLPKQKRK